ncbi:MAG: hypothetical protein HQL53_09930 [Magnetococcales bacterium]|nr:hypothetical protein [Magnetococcales bacterium]
MANKISIKEGMPLGYRCSNPMILQEYRLMRRIFHVIVMALFLWGTVPTAHAFTLGRIQVLSAMGAPFHAKIPITFRTDEDPGRLKIALGTPDDYRVLNLASPIGLPEMQFDLITSGAKPELVIRSSGPLNAPAFDLLLKTGLGRGSHFRHFPILLPLPKNAVMTPPARVSTTSTSPAPAITLPKSHNAPNIHRAPVVRRPSVVQQPDPTPIPARRRAAAPRKARRIITATGPRTKRMIKPTAGTNSYPDHYGPVRRGDTLYDIAMQISHDSGLPWNKAATAIWKRNPNAFMNGDINLLRIGTRLELPPMAEVRRIRYAEVRAAFNPPTPAPNRHDHEDITWQSESGEPIEQPQKKSQPNNTTPTTATPANTEPADEALQSAQNAMEAVVDTFPADPPTVTDSAPKRTNTEPSESTQKSPDKPPTVNPTVSDDRVNFGMRLAPVDNDNTIRDEVERGEAGDPVSLRLSQRLASVTELQKQVTALTEQLGESEKAQRTSGQQIKRMKKRLAKLEAKIKESGGGSGAGDAVWIALLTLGVMVMALAGLLAWLGHRLRQSNRQRQDSYQQVSDEGMDATPLFPEGKSPPVAADITPPTSPLTSSFMSDESDRDDDGGMEPENLSPTAHKKPLNEPKSTDDEGFGAFLTSAGLGNDTDAMESEPNGDPETETQTATDDLDKTPIEGSLPTANEDETPIDEHLSTHDQDETPIDEHLSEGPEAETLSADPAPDLNQNAALGVTPSDSEDNPELSGLETEELGISPMPETDPSLDESQLNSALHGTPELLDSAPPTDEESAAALGVASPDPEPEPANGKGIDTIQFDEQNATIPEAESPEPQESPPQLESIHFEAASPSDAPSEETSRPVIKETPTDDVESIHFDKNATSTPSSTINKETEPLPEALETLRFEASSSPQNSEPDIEEIDDSHEDMDESGLPIMALSNSPTPSPPMMSTIHDDAQEIGENEAEDSLELLSLSGDDKHHSDD